MSEIDTTQSYWATYGAVSEGAGVRELEAARARIADLETQSVGWAESTHQSMRELVAFKAAWDEALTKLAAAEATIARVQKRVDALYAEGAARMVTDQHDLFADGLRRAAMEIEAVLAGPDVRPIGFSVEAVAAVAELKRRLAEGGET